MNTKKAPKDLHSIMSNFDLDGLVNDSNRNKNEFKVAAAQFVKTELSLSLTFVEAARFYTSNGKPKRARENRDHAQKALAQAQKFFPMADFTKDENLAYKEKILQLQLLLRAQQ